MGTVSPAPVRCDDERLRILEQIKNKNMREYKTKLFKQQSALVMCIISTMYHFAPNGVVRHRVENSGRDTSAFSVNQRRSRRSPIGIFIILQKDGRKKIFLIPLTSIRKRSPLSATSTTRREPTARCPTGPRSRTLGTFGRALNCL